MIRAVVMRPGEAPAEQALDVFDVVLVDARCEDGALTGLVSPEMREREIERACRVIVGGGLGKVATPSAMPRRTVLYCNEAGVLDKLPVSFRLPGGEFVRGAVVAVGLDEGDGTRSLTEDEARAICTLLMTLRRQISRGRSWL